MTGLDNDVYDDDDGDNDFAKSSLLLIIFADDHVIASLL